MPKGIPSLPLYENENVIEVDPDQSQFTQRLTARAVSFTERNRDKPLFLHVPHIMLHVPIFASQKFRGMSGRGFYGDVVQELDWSVGEIVATLTRNRSRTTRASAASRAATVIGSRKSAYLSTTSGRIRARHGIQPPPGPKS